MRGNQFGHASCAEASAEIAAVRLNISRREIIVTAILSKLLRD